MSGGDRPHGLRRGWLVGLAALPAAFGVAVPAAPLSAQAPPALVVADGDTFSIGGKRIRLYGIDAPEGRQMCRRDGVDWACGAAAARQLRGLIADRPVHCRTIETDSFGRAVAVCHAGGVELNRAMVRYGWAVAFRRYSQDYVADELQARSARLGIWRSQFVQPEEWRAMHNRAAAGPGHGHGRAGPGAAQPVAPPQTRCTIKGNRNRKGQWIYHLPGMPYYAATRAEAWFCSEAEAQAAGYRRAIVR